MSDLYTRIYSQAKRNESEIVRILTDLVRIPSFSTKEKDVIRVIRQWMDNLGFDEVRIDRLGNVIGRIGSGPRLLAFDAHIDTVYAGDTSQWDFDPFTPKVENGRVWGRGTADQKGGMAAMLGAARLIRELNLNEQFTILFTGTVMEEDCDGLCWQYLIREEQIRPEVVVITEPTDLRIYRGHRGRMEIRVHVSGISCHGSAPERGDNAIYKISRLALEIEKLNNQLAFDPFLGTGTVAVTEVTSGSPSLCAVPDQAGLHLDRRLTAGETKETALNEIRAAAQRAGCNDASVIVPPYNEAAYTGLRYMTEKYYPTWITPEDSPYLKTADTAYQKLFKRAPVIDKWTFSTNGVAIAGMHGIPCIGLGPGQEVFAHAPNENCPVEQLSDAAAFYAGFVAQLNGRD